MIRYGAANTRISALRSPLARARHGDMEPVVGRIEQRGAAADMCGGSR